MKLRRNEIDKIIFDMDGVITSEYCYWKTAALTVYELMYSREYYGVQEIDREWCYKNLDLIYDTIFCGGKTVRAVKKTGVNTNWDLAYVVFCVSQYLNPKPDTFDRQNFESVCMFIENMEISPPELYVGLEGLVATVLSGEIGDFKRGTGKLWKEITDCFQKWFHGDEEIPGIKEEEYPLLPLEKIKDTLSGLKKQGFKLGIGTGRPEDETVYPLKLWGLYEFFEPDLFAAYDQVLNAEKTLNPETPLAKPHPFVFRKAAFGSKFSDKELYDGVVTEEMAGRCLVVGDAPSDLMSAQAGGFKFAAVLTGISGKDGQAYFEENRADMIFDSILDLRVNYENQD